MASLLAIDVNEQGMKRKHDLCSISVPGSPELGSRQVQRVVELDDRVRLGGDGLEVGLGLRHSRRSAARRLRSESRGSAFMTVERTRERR